MRFRESNLLLVVWHGRRPWEYFGALVVRVPAGQDHCVQTELHPGIVAERQEIRLGKANQPTKIVLWGAAKFDGCSPGHSLAPATSSRGSANQRSVVT
jgi:hypothetical protein